jgi:Uma2 family endonuclease
MATVTEPRITPEDLLTISDRPMPELVDGQLVERDMSQGSDLIAARILGLLWDHVEAHQLGFVNGAQGSYQVFPFDPDRVRIPDVSFTRRERLSASGPSKGHGRVAPDLVVEVMSTNDSALTLDAKIEDYLEVGIPLIWVVNPETRTVRVLRSDRSSVNLRPKDTIDGGEVIPGFRCQVESFFNGVC